MPKLFVAAELPAPVTAELARIQPPPTPDVRLPARDQMHLTLHYVGETDAERMAAALAAVSVPAFALTIEGVGQFLSADGSITLWAGVRESALLLDLHAAVAAALAGEGFRPETRRYSPHITLARCGPEAPACVAEDFLARNKRLLLPDALVREFGLYSSAFVENAPVYQRERAFPLATTSTTGELRGP